MAKKTVLLTGFEPFDGQRVNPSWQAVERAVGRGAAGPERATGPEARAGVGGVEGLEGGESLKGVASLEGLDVRAERLSCVFGTALDELRTAVSRHDPDLVLCVGQWGGRTGLAVERTAVNLDDARIPDNAGRQPVDEPVVPGGPTAYFSSLPVKACVAALREAGLPASVSRTAGAFVCNHVFFGLAHLLATERPGVRGGFVHVPFSPEQVPDGKRPSMAVADMARGLGIVAATAARTERDVRLVGGPAE